MVILLGGAFATLALVAGAVVVTGWSQRDRWGLVYLTPALVVVPFTALASVHACGEGNPFTAWAVPALLSLPVGFFGPTLLRWVLLPAYWATGFVLALVWAEVVHGEDWSGTDEVTIAQHRELEPLYEQVRSSPGPLPSGELGPVRARMGVRAGHTWWSGLYPREEVELVLVVPGGPPEDALAGSEVVVRPLR